MKNMKTQLSFYHETFEKHDKKTDLIFSFSHSTVCNQLIAAKEAKLENKIEKKWNEKYGFAQDAYKRKTPQQFRNVNQFIRKNKQADTSAMNRYTYPYIQTYVCVYVFHTIIFMYACMCV